MLLLLWLFAVCNLGLDAPPLTNLPPLQKKNRTFGHLGLWPQQLRPMKPAICPGLSDLSPVSLYIYMEISTKNLGNKMIWCTWVFLHQLFGGDEVLLRSYSLGLNQPICNHQIGSFLQGSGWKRTFTYLSCRHLDEKRNPGILDRLVKHK